MPPPTSTPFAEAPFGPPQGGPPTALDPAGPVAEWITGLSWVMFVGGTVIFLATMAALWLAIRGGETWRRRLGTDGAIKTLGIGVPVVVLTALLVYGLGVTGAIAGLGREDAVKVRVVGEQYWWRVQYLDGASTAFETANEIVIPVGRTIEFELTGGDVIHSFWVPELSGKLDMVPGRTNRLRLKADRAGVFRGQCTEFCGAQHALMAFQVIAVSPADYGAWRAGQLRPAAAPATAFLARGQRVFAENRCGRCHAVAGTPARGAIAPNLTHVGSRRTIGAGVLPRNTGTLGGWTAQVQSIKPGAKMPDYDTLSGRDLHAVSAYLESLK